jgi:hypothetical protein
VRNKLIGKVRIAVERTFSELKCGPYGFTRMRYCGLARCPASASISPSSPMACTAQQAERSSKAHD